MSKSMRHDLTVQMVKLSDLVPWGRSICDAIRRRRDAALASEAPKPYERPIGCHAAGCAAGFCAGCSQVDGRVYKHATGCPCASLVSVRKRGPEEVPKDGARALLVTKREGVRVAEWFGAAWHMVDEYGRRTTVNLLPAAVIGWIPLDEF